MIETQTLLSLFSETRALTEALCKPLEIEDYVVQPTLDVSPPKWHLGHTTWFFETFILEKYKPNYKLFHDDFAYVFNSYYETLGKRVIRSDRGNLSRPGVTKVYDYRHYVTHELKAFLEEGISAEIEEVLLIGIHHEKQHQELLMTDIKYILGNNPLLPAYRESFIENPEETLTQDWLSFSEGVYEIGYAGNDFCYDNEQNRHKTYCQNFEISNRLVTNEEFIEFIDAGGYKDFNYWHADGWEWVNAENISQPMYWHKIEGEWFIYTFEGLQKISLKSAVCHISYYEAFAYAQWKECRLPTEFEWEVAQGSFNWGSRWEWTESSYLPYPGYSKAPGALGEYNGKFMVNQKVLRGGSVVTAPNHTRSTYRNFFQPNLRWQFTGIRLAK
ncbi:ergothioneine biosynthesis protein EgtB [Rasiella rasia]|uniref:Ergothioneine biosynthesis protein EgtB n=1 Tax=Rasiella rasia TaxID=2744027 RepID=A0A6G6GNS1_9FLAO|nr:ergothioneine biosynthesis protein EgtB [Rasiella rasia]QIE60226.1 ergothioneine biosynthesis protein EgtB [Rasiella rasia]